MLTSNSNHHHHPNHNRNQCNQGNRGISSETYMLQLVNKIDKLLLSREIYFNRKTMAEEIRTLEFWRSIIVECVCSFFYVFLVCATHISWTGSLIGHQPNWIVMSLTSGLAMATLIHCFGHISGANINPAITLSLLATRHISTLRAVLYLIAQCGGAIAGAALLYGVSIPGHQGALGISLAHEALSSSQIFAVEFVLTFIIVFTVFSTLDVNRKSIGSDSLSIGLAYLVCSLAGLPASGASLNPARALGPSFVMNKWKHHWIYWMAPISGGIVAGLIYEFIFDTKRNKPFRDFGEEAEQECRETFDEPKVKMNPASKMLMTYSASGSSHSTSDSSSSGHQSNNTGYSSLNTGPTGHGTIGYPPNSLHTSTRSPALANTFQHAVQLEGLYGHHHPNNINGPPLPPMGSFHSHQPSSESVYGLYGSRSATLRHLPTRLEYNNSRNDAINNSSKY